MPSPARWKKALSHASRSRSFLWKLAIGFILAGIAIGSAIHHIRPSGPEKLAERVFSALVSASPDESPAPSPKNLQGALLTAFEEELANPNVGFPHLVNALPQLAPMLSGSLVRVRSILEKRFTPAEASLAADFIALYSGDPAIQKSSDQRLREVAATQNPPRFAYHLIGVYEQLHGDPTLAAGHFIQEGRHPDAIDSRRRAVQALIAAKQFSKLERLQQEDASYSDLVTASDRLSIAVAQKKWPAIFKEVPLSLLTQQQAGLLLLTLVTGIGWAFFLFHLGEVGKFFSATTLLCFAGLILGVLSTTPTVYAVIWQDDFLNFSRTGSSLQPLVYQVGGVGLREEFCKLLLFLPLLPFLVKRGSDLEALLVASFVGLGFAVEENGSYFYRSQGVDGPGRFLTANFLHIALTGLNGLALFRAVTWGSRGINEFLTVFPLTVLVHGLYNGLSEVPELMELGGYLSITLYVLTSIIYFNRAYQLRENVRMTISLTGAFILGLSVVSAMVLIEQITAIGPGPGLTRIIPEFLGVGVMVLMFTRVFNEGLSE
jgi:RsiW-degrading membrane proteinase PrsW (M82 family)